MTTIPTRAPTSCPVCGGPLVADFCTTAVAVSRCRACGHRVAAHAHSDPSLDYHRQYDQGAFLESLGRTRRRQAAEIIALIRRHLPDADRLLDVGAGRGWFLDACRAAGIAEIAGADSSPDAVTGLRQQGIEAILLSGPDPSADLRILSFAPRILTLLDVVEHFPVAGLTRVFGDLLAAFRGSLELVVVKVPVAEGFLYRASRIAAAAGIAAPIEQLYQVGTSPPHFSYFSRSSMRRLLTRAEVIVVEEAGLPELDGSSAGGRVAALRRLPPLAGRAAGRVISWVETVSPRDAGVFVAVPAGRTSGSGA